ncbi:MAG: hypothetical protein LBU48_06710 [Coriobacteriales bacterium]|jgi:asparagine synthase (glutamine-hydrolysing)|nr:hypothetical protein [Coriobacteriales bacterium]
MSGIAGYYDIDAGNELLASMGECLAHRGPDGEGRFVGVGVGLVHRWAKARAFEAAEQAPADVLEARQLVASVSVDGEQPLRSGDGRLVLLVDGALYNRQELVEELRATGASLKAQTDAEVMLAAYSAWGTAAFDRFNGAFALALYNTAEHTLILARDHFGIKPLHYAALAEAPSAPLDHPEHSAQRAGKELSPATADISPASSLLPGLLFASELKPLVFSGRIERKPNDRIIYRYLRYRVHDDGKETFFAGIKRLLPGQMLTASAEGISVETYSTLQRDLTASAHSSTHRRFDTSAQARFAQEFRQSVRLRLRGEAAAGCTLSGGMDSSAVVAVICNLMRDEPQATVAVGAVQQAFSAVFPHSVNDEERYIDAVANRYPQTLRVHKVAPKPEEFLEDLHDFIRTQEEPLISTGPYAQYRVTRAASSQVKVLLDGEGADEMLAGYVPYYLVYFRQLLARKRYLRLFKELVLASDKMLRLVRFKLFARLSSKKSFDSTTFLNQEFTARFAGEKLDAVSDNLKLRLMNDLFYDSTPCSIRYVDRNTARFGVENRSPFLDKDLVRYIFSLDDEAIIKNSWNKRVLSDSIEDILPKEIWGRRNKVGFSTPEDEWFGVLKETFHEILRSPSFAARPYFNQPQIMEAYNAFCDGSGEASTMVFWRLLNVELWLREFID